MTHTLSGWTSKLYYEKKDKEARQKLERLRARRSQASAQTSTPKKDGKTGGRILNDTIDITSPEKTPKKGGSEERQETKKRSRDEVDTDYSTDDDLIPSECDDEAKLVIHRKNKKIKLTKKLLKGEEARIRYLKQKVKDQEEELSKLKTKSNDVEGKEKTLAEQETDQQRREQLLVEKETEMESKNNDIEREKQKIAKKAEAVKKTVLSYVPNNWITSDGNTIKATLDKSIKSILESDEEDKMDLDEESGINTLESGHFNGTSNDDGNDGTEGNMENLPEDLQDIRDEDLNMNLLDDNEGDTQVIIKSHRMDIYEPCVECTGDQRRQRRGRFRAWWQP